MTDTQVLTPLATPAPARPPNWWKPGQSGNPTGKPKDPARQEALKILLAATPECARKLVELAKSGDARAIDSVLDRTLGKPAQRVENADGSGPADWFLALVQAIQGGQTSVLALGGARAPLPLLDEGDE